VEPQDRRRSLWVLNPTGLFGCFTQDGCPDQGRKYPAVSAMIGIIWMEPVDCRSSPDVKIALFRSLFRGRDDVYPRRFESRRTGKSGYAPACGNEWVQGICEKPRIKCANCPHRRFLTVTDDVIRWHLSGRDNTGQPFGGGVYPMLQDETCFFLAADFDMRSCVFSQIAGRSLH